MAEKKFELKSEPAPDPKLPLKPPAPSSPARPERRKRDSARLVWDSKPKRPPSPRDIEFQTAEVVIPNPARDAGSLPFTFRDGILDDEQVDRSKMNRLIWGDNLLAMQALLAQGYEGKIDLIYIDPPFDSKSDYSYRMTIDELEITKEPSVIERLAYRDTWEAGTDSYLDMLYPRLQLMKRLLSEAGSLYLHIGPNISHYVRVMLDEIFGTYKFQNEIVWKRRVGSSSAVHESNRFGICTDVILLYTKSTDPIFHAQFNPDAPDYQEYIAAKFTQVEPDGRRYRTDNLANPSPRPNLIYEYKGYKPPRNGWAISREKMAEWDAAGRLYFPKDLDGRIARKRYVDELKGKPIQNLWDDIAEINSQADERLDFQTQKPETLIERILNTSSNAGSLVADFFCGSGTTAAVAERLGRRWITSDLGKVGVQVTRGRLVQQDAKPFLIENIGNYQREMIYLTGGRIGEMQRIILKLYGATPHPSYKDLGVRQAEPSAPLGTGDKVTELVYVGYPDRPTTAKKVEELARMAESLDGDGYKRLVILAWDYDYSYDEAWDARIKASKKPLRVEVQKKLIPPDVYDYLKKAKTEADIEKLADKIVFHEKPYLKLTKPAIGKKADGKREVTIGIDRYVLFDLPVPEKDQEKLRELVKENFAVLIDYWAIDWTYDGATFKSQWQAIRGNGKKAKIVPTSVTEKLDAGRKYTIAVRVVDVFGNDAAGTVVVEA
jgi:adenine-specific DNA-methyltransferase